MSAAWNAKERAKQKENGLCSALRCVLPPEPNKRCCHYHLLLNKRYAKRYRIRVALKHQGFTHADAHEPQAVH